MLSCFNTLLSVGLNVNVNPFRLNRAARASDGLLVSSALLQLHLDSSQTGC